MVLNGSQVLNTEKWQYDQWNNEERIKVVVRGVNTYKACACWEHQTQAIYNKHTHTTPETAPDQSWLILYCTDPESYYNTPSFSIS